MRILKFILKAVLTLTLILAVIGWLFYDQYSPKSVSQPDPQVVNDVTGLNPVNVAYNVRPTTQQQIMDAVLATTGPISIGGARYSMGGQIAYPDSLHLDMRDYNQILHLDTGQRLITVQSGITWQQIQHQIDPHNLSIMIMQDFNNFTVGGSLSVNAHGRYMGAGAIINSVQSIKLVLADGRLYEASRSHNAPLFYAAIGGYGGIGVITEVTLQLVDNEPMQRSTRLMVFNQFLDYFRDQILHDDSVLLHNAVLYPPNFELIRDISWRRTDQALTETDRLRSYDRDHWWKPAAVDMMARSDLLKRVRKAVIDPLLMQRDAVVMRNYQSSYDLHEFGFAARSNSTLALREYFVPVQNFEVFVLKLRDVFMRNDVNVLNVSVRYAPRDDESLLAWAKQDVFCFVVSYQQDKDEASIKKVELWSNLLNQAAVESGGSYYMPFQIQDSPELFHQAYPKAQHFFDVKRWADPNNRFNNLLWLAFFPDNAAAKAAWANAQELKKYQREESNAHTTYYVKGGES